MKVVLAGRDTEERKEEYNTASAMLTECGHDVYSISGAVNDQEFLRISLKLIDCADALVMLDGWQEDSVSIVQSEYAVYMEKMLFDFKQFKEDYMRNNGWKN